LQAIDAANVPQLKVYNKIDLLPDVQPHIDYNAEGKPIAVWISAKNNIGCDLLGLALSELFNDGKVRRKCFLPAHQAGIKAKIFSYVQILDETVNDSGDSEMTIVIDRKFLGLLKDIQVEDLN
jgi:GTPase